MNRAEVVVCGAGLAGISTAFHLAVRRKVGDVLLVDPRPPLTLTSDKSTECYRNWWPSEPMVRFMNRSIDLLEELAVETDNVFGLNRRGYLFVTTRPDQVDEWIEQGEKIAGFGAGAVRIHRDRHPQVTMPPATGLEGVPDGIDLLVGPALHHVFGWVAPDAVAGMWVRRAGWLSAQQLGAALLDRARGAGVRTMRAAVEGVEVQAGRVSAVILDGGEQIACSTLVNAAGPMLKEVGAMVGVDLPVHCEAHHKVAFRDRLGAFPREAPMTILADPQTLDWDPEERRHLAEEGREDLLGELPRFCHGRPEGGPGSPWVLALWEYRREVVDPPVFPMPEDPLYPEVAIRGMARLVPAMGRYRDALPETVVDGGYYTKTGENLPLIGPAGPDGHYVCGALSGYGVMAAAAAGDLCAAWIVGEDLPDYASVFHPEKRSTRLASLDIGDTGQL